MNIEWPNNIEWPDQDDPVRQRRIAALTHPDGQFIEFAARFYQDGWGPLTRRETERILDVIEQADRGSGLLA